LGSPPGDRPGTEKNPRALEWADDVACVCAPDEAKETADKFKTAVTRKKTFKLPNPFYFTP